MKVFTQTVLTVYLSELLPQLGYRGSVQDASVYVDPTGNPGSMLTLIFTPPPDDQVIDP